MLQDILDATGLNARTCAGLLGISPDVFLKWASGQEAIPDSYIPLLASVLSVPPTALSRAAKGLHRQAAADATPQIWFKFKGEGLVDADRECVLLVRLIGHHLNELEDVTRQRTLQWKTVFETIRGNVDVQAPVGEQGKSAARLFRLSTALGHGARGGGKSCVDSCVPSASWPLRSR